MTDKTILTIIIKLFNEMNLNFTNLHEMQESEFLELEKKYNLKKMMDTFNEIKNKLGDIEFNKLCLEIKNEIKQKEDEDKNELDAILIKLNVKGS